nr:MAG TPA: hypothetical protein [Caudoviricetes sp.]
MDNVYCFADTTHYPEYKKSLKQGLFMYVIITYKEIFFQVILTFLL